MIPLSVPNMNGNELKYASAAIAEGWVSTGGKEIVEFENKMAARVGAKGGVACQSGTAGLHLSMLACGVKPGDEVIVPTLTFIAAVNPVRYAGADPVFMDCDDTLCMDMDKLDCFCREECRAINGELIHTATGRCVRAVVVVHVFGNIADMDRLMDIAAAHHLKVIEDSTEAVGSYFLTGRYKGRFAGTIGDIGVYSFNGNKIMTTGGGGMIVSNNQQLLDLTRHLSTQAKVDTVRFTHDMVGYNYRMTNLQAAVGLAQLEQLDQFIETKRSNYNRYISRGIELLPFRSDCSTNYWLYSYMTDRREELMAHLTECGIQSRPIWYLIHEAPFYKNCLAYKIERATYYWERVLNIPSSSGLTPEEVDIVAGAIHSLK